MHLKSVVKLPVIILIFSLLFVSLPPQPAASASIVVTTEADEQTVDGACSLREAIRNANEKGKSQADCEAGTGVDTITFAPGVSTITLGGALPNIKEDLTIGGGGSVTVSGGGTVFVFQVNNKAQLTLNSITVADGYSAAGNGGGVLNNGTLIVQNSQFENNYALLGGAIYAAGDMTSISDTTFTTNTALVSGGGIVFTGGVNTVSGSLFTGNTGDSAGGLLVETGASLTMTNTTLAGNLAFDSTGLGGGGVLITGGSANLTHVTLSGNSSAALGSGISQTGGTVTLENTIVADSTGGNCSGTITDGGGNLVWGDTTCPGSSLDPNLQTLSDNGGATQTMALGSGSGAVNLGVSVNCPAADQRGFNRRSGYCDSGAFEAQPVALAVVSGSPQYAVTGYSFADPLVASAVDSFGNALGGLAIDFTAPASGASAALSSATGTTGAVGTASVNATANDTIGAYEVTASSGTFTPVTFSLSNAEVLVASITRAGSNPTNSAVLGFTVTFAVPVTGVDESDFTVVSGGAVSGAAITDLTGTGDTYTISVGSGAGDGTVRLDLLDDDSILDSTYNRILGGPGLENGDFSGETYTVDKTPPDTTITGGPSNPTNSTDASFSFEADEPAGGFECSLDAGAFTTCSNPAETTGLAEGNHTFSVQAVDLAGNTDLTPASFGWTVDFTKPTALMDPLPPESGPTIPVSWSGSDALSGIASFDIQLQVDGGGWTSWMTSTTDLSAEYAGESGHTYQFRVRALDNAGNAGNWSDPVETRTETTIFLPLIIR